jgi:hypothetical protein
MFVYSTNSVGITQRVVATLVACAVVMATVGIYNTAQAANLTFVSNTLTDSTPLLASGHLISFIAEGAILVGENITVTFDNDDAGAGGQSFNGGDISAAITDATDLTFTVNGSGAVAPTFVSSDTDSFVVNGIAATAGQEVEIIVALAAGVTNPAKVLAAGIGDSYEIAVAVANTAGPDSGNTRVVIIDNVVVTAEVATSFEFEVRPVDVGVTVNGLTTTGSSSSTTIPFGELTAGPGNDEFIAQQLSVITNSINGFVVTVEKDGELRSSTGAEIDTFFDATDETSPTAWASPNSTLAFGENGWGHWGMTTEDGDVNDAAAPDFTGTDEYIAVLDTPQTIFGHSSVCDGTTTGGGNATTDDECLTEVGYRIEISSLQEAGDDYTATLTYIATPTF